MSIKFTSGINTQESVAELTNCVAEIYIDVGADVDGFWDERFVKVDDVSGVFQKSPKRKIVHIDDGSEALIGTARLSLSRAPKNVPRIVRVNGEFWKVEIDKTRETRLQYKYDLEYMSDEPAISTD